MNRRERRKSLQFMYEMVVAPAKERWEHLMYRSDDRNPWTSEEYETYLAAKLMMAEASGNEKQQHQIFKEQEHIAYLKYIATKLENENA